MKLTTKLARVQKTGKRTPTIDKAVDEMSRNIVEEYRRADYPTIVGGTAWYLEAFDWVHELAEDTGYHPAQVAATVAITSPRCSWEQNLKRAEAVLTVGIERTVGLFSWQRDRLAEMLASDSPPGTFVRGPKVSRFFQNIMGAEVPVTVDIWALRIALGDETAGDAEYKMCVGTETRYALIEEAYQRAAQILDVMPSVVQAVTWVSMRERVSSTPANEGE